MVTILFVRNSMSGFGDSIRINTILAFLRKSGYIVHEIVIPSFSLTYLKKEVPKLLVSIFPLSLVRPYDLKYPLVQYLNTNIAKNYLTKVNRKIAYDVIIAETSLAGWFALKYLKRGTRPLIVDVHGLEGEESKGRKDKFWHLRESLENEVFRNSDHLFVVSEEMKEYIIRFSMIPREKISVVYNGSNKTCFRAQFKQPLNIIFAGFLAYWENVDSYLDIAKEANGEHFRFYLAGDGPLKKHLLTRIKREHIPITYLGYIPRQKMLAVMSSMQVGIAPSSKDIARLVAFPIKILDYMSCGLPIISPKIGDWGRMIEEVDCGIALENDAVTDYVNALEALSSQKIWENKSKNAKIALNSMYTWNTVLQPVKKVLYQLCSEKL